MTKELFEDDYWEYVADETTLEVSVNQAGVGFTTFDGDHAYVLVPNEKVKELLDFLTKRLKTNEV